MNESRWDKEIFSTLSFTAFVAQGEHFPLVWIADEGEKIFIIISFFYLCNFISRSFLSLYTFFTADRPTDIILFLCKKSRRGFLKSVWIFSEEYEMSD